MNSLKVLITLTLMISSGLKAHAEMPDLSPDILAPDSYVKILGSADMISSELTGSGFNHDTASDVGVGYILKFDHALGADSGRLGFQYSSTDVEAESPSSISPDSIDVQRSEYLVYYKTPTFKDGFLKNSRVGIGYFLFEYEADQTTPNILITNQRAEGLNLSIDHESVLSSSLITSLGGGVFVPFRFNEEKANTGYFRDFYAIYISGSVDYSLGRTSDFALSAGFHLQRDYAKFEGTGNRGSSNSEDIRYLFRLPVGLKYSF
jgi:hypothetical protein